MLGKRKWGLAGLVVGLGLCTIGWVGCAAGGGGGGPTEAGAALDVNFGGAAGGNFAVAQDDEGNEYTFRANDAGEMTEANIRMTDGRTVKVSLDAQGRPVKFRASDNTNADLIYGPGNQARIRYTSSSGEAQDVSDIDYTAARARIQQRRALQGDKRQRAMQASEGVNRLRSGLQTYEEVVESVFDEEQNPDTPLRDTPLEKPVKRIARIVDEAQVREVNRDQIGAVELDRVPSEIEALAGRSFELFEAEGFCIDQLGAAEGEPLIKSVLTFDPNGILLTETDRKFLFDLGLGGIDRDITINWNANTTIDLTVGQDVDFTAEVTPVFTGTQLDDNRRVTLERRFLAGFTFPVEAFTTTEARTEQLFNAAFINGALTGNVLEFDLVLIDLANETEPRPLAILRYYDQNTVKPTELLFPCSRATGTGKDAGSGLKCPTEKKIDPYQFFTVEFTDREAAVDPDRSRRLEYEWYVSSGYGYVEDDTRYSQVATVVPTDEGLLEISLIVSDPAAGGEFDLHVCEVRVGEISTEGAFLDCPVSMSVGEPDDFYLVGGGDAVAASTRQTIGDTPGVATGDTGDRDTLLEWFVFGTSDFFVSDPFSAMTEITFNEAGRWEVWLVAYQPDGTEAFASCEVSVDAAGYDECEEFGWYGDGICDEFCPLPDSDCRGDTVSDWCEGAGYYGDGICDPDCPQPDPDCEAFDWCAELGYYGDGVCDPDCPLSDPDCETTDVCAENGWYGDGVCDEFCPQIDPDCGGGDICAENGWYGDGICDDFCSLPDPDCDSGFEFVQCSSDSDCGFGAVCVDGMCVMISDGGGA